LSPELYIIYTQSLSDINYWLDCIRQYRIEESNAVYKYDLKSFGAIWL
jgi:hypothetical protein